ncbi:MAG: hypothetical protein ACYCYE_18140 [Clostridia bacterium]
MPLCGIGFIAALVGLAGYTGVFAELEDTMNGFRIGSTLEYANTAAIYFLIVVVFVVSLTINNRNIFIKAFLAGVGNVIFMALFFTSSRGVFLVVPLIVFLIFFLVMPKGVRLESAIYILCITMPVLAGMKGYDAILSSTAAFLVDNIPQNVITRLSDINLQTRNVVLRLEFQLHISSMPGTKLSGYWINSGQRMSLSLLSLLF